MSGAKAVMGGTVEADLRFLQKLPVYRREQPSETSPSVQNGVWSPRTSNLRFEDHKIAISDVRESKTVFTLEEHGFQVIESPSRLSPEDFKEPFTVESQYFAELETLLRSVDGSFDRVFFFDWRLRSSDVHGSQPQPGKKARTSWQTPSGRVHVDNSPEQILQRVQNQMRVNPAFLLQCRMRIINIWRPIENEVQDYPLAFCDGTSVPPEDLIACDHDRWGTRSQTLLAHHNPNHKWYYISRQKPQEVTLMKQYDSNTDVRAKCCPHTSFRDPNSGTNPLPRKSIEVRALVLNFPRGLQLPQFANRWNAARFQQHHFAAHRN